MDPFSCLESPGPLGKMVFDDPKFRGHDPFSRGHGDSRWVCV